MMINSDDLLAHVAEQMEKSARRCMDTKQMDLDEIQWEKGRYSCYKELARWVDTNYGSDSQ